MDESDKSDHVKDLRTNKGWHLQGCAYKSDDHKMVTGRKYLDIQEDGQNQFTSLLQTQQTHTSLLPTDEPITDIAH